MVTQNEIESEEIICSDCGEKISGNEIKCPKCGAEFEIDIDTTDWDEAVTQGRKLTITIIGVSAAVLLLTGTIKLVNIDAVGLLTYFIRLGLTALLLTLLYKGYNGARIIMIVLFAIGGVDPLIMGISMMSKSGLSIILILLGVLYIGISVILAVVKSIKIFQESQREYYKMSKEN